MSDDRLILIADDDPTQRLLTARTLEAEGYRTIEAEDGDMAIALTLKARPALVILDVVMPGLSGFEVCARIRAHADIDIAAMPVLMATGLEDDASVEAAFEAGASSFISKPVQWSLLGHKTRYLLRAADVEAELRAAKAAVEEASLLKSRLFATLCHELRTPLNGVIGFADAIGNEMLGPIEDKRYLEFARDIRASGDMLLEQVNRMLLISRLEGGLRPLKPSSAAVEPMLEEAAKRHRRQADARAIAINVRPMAAPLRIDVDVEVLRAALTALVGNAVKFSPFGGVVEISAERADDGVEIRVTDQGDGVPDAALARLAEPFRQVDGGLDRAHEGLGLGLPIAKLAAARHGGALRLANRPTGGFEATLRLPLGAAPSGMARAS